MELEQKLLAYFQEHEQEIFSDLEKLVACEADTADIESLKKVREVLKTIIKEAVRTATASCTSSRARASSSSR